MADIVESWLWRDPGEIVDRLLERSAREAARRQGLEMGAADGPRDRYYTMARRCEVRGSVKRVLRGVR